MINTAAVALLRSLALGCGIYHKVIPNAAALPAISYMIVSDNKVNNLSRGGYYKSRLQVTAVSDDAVVTCNLMKTIRQNLPPIRGDFADINILNIVDSGMVSNATTSPHSVTCDFFVSHKYK